MDASNYQRSNNPYSHDKCIRQYLIKAGLINNRGDILRKTSYRVILAERVKPKYVKARASLNVINYAIEEERKHRLIVRNEFDTSIHRSRRRESRRPQPNSLIHTNASARSNNIRPLTARSLKRSPIRAKSVHRSPTNTKNLLVRRSMTMKQVSNDELCQVTMIYYGSQLNHDYNNDWYQSNGDEIIVMQQHSGSENLLVYKGFVRPNETFTFESRRHPNYSFALTLYVNSYIDSRISVCCEYKHKHNVRIGGSCGSFGIYDIQKSRPCQRCRFEKYKKEILPTSSNTTRSRTKSANRTTLSPPLKSIRKQNESSQSKKTQKNKRSKTLGPSTSLKSSNELKNNSMITFEDTSFTSDQRSSDGRKNGHRKSLNISSNILTESRPSTPTILNEPEDYPYSSEFLSSTVYNDNQRLNILERSAVSPIYLSDIDNDNSTTSPSNNSFAQNNLHKNQSLQSMKLSSLSASSTSASIPTFSNGNDSTTAKQHTSSPSSSFALSDEEQISDSSTSYPNVVNLLNQNRQNGRFSPTSSTQSSVENNNRVVHKPKRHRLSISLTDDTTTSDEHTNLK